MSPADFAAYEVIERAPVEARYRNRRVLTNAPPSSGGVLIAYALGLLERAGEPPPLDDPDTLALVADAMAGASRARGGDFHQRLHEEGFAASFLAGDSRLGSTTHISVLDDAGWAGAFTCTNVEGSGLVVPGTGVHVNNMMGEQDLSPLGYFTHPPGRRLPSMMAPTVVLSGGRPELVLGSAGSNRIRSALLQVIVNVVDRGMDARAAVEAPRLHWEDGSVYTEPGIDHAALEAAGCLLAPFRDRNLFFGGCQAVERSAEGVLSGGGDPRRGGAVVVVTGK
jgi:gamma-glutamyltranspeptidase/glutathione hydrolase